ncbi:hypothetical protein DPMN_177634 [Dreissena polymorpha]|uniref:Uncharacterized protein n=1 Tax=Dreissena polymorpha TaxID=45954 RepID=A0A9D4EBH3_DREPO|nr:hypothetical protein DPMN_177634 [Dreissena polymorpha]
MCRILRKLGIMHNRFQFIGRISKVPEPRDFFGYVWDNRIMPLFANSVAERSKHGRGSPNTKPPTHGQEKRRLKYFWKHLQETY